MALSGHSDIEDDEMNRKPNYNDWLLVKFEGNTSFLRFVGLEVRFARIIEDSKFEWLEIENICVVGEDHIETILRRAIINTKNDRVTSFIFGTVFEDLSVS